MSAGVIILLSAAIQKQPTNTTEIIPGRVRRVDIDLHKLSLYLINICAPNIGTDCQDCRVNLDACAGEEFIYREYV